LNRTRSRSSRKMERYNTDKSWHRTDDEEWSGFTPRMALI
jgi:hypothetical protein